MSRNCRTDGAVYEIEIGRGVVSCKVFLPPTVKARLNSYEMRKLKQDIHNGMENALAPFFPQYPERQIRADLGLVHWDTTETVTRSVQRNIDAEPGVVSAFKIKHPK